MRMKVKKAIKYSAWTLLALFSIYVYLFLYPQILFKYKISYRNFNVYSNENMDDRIPAIIDTAINKLKVSEIYDSMVTQKVFFINQSLYCTMTFPYYKERSAFHEFLINNTMIVRPPFNISNPDVVSRSYDNSLARSITHEVIHSMQCHRLGFWKAIKAPEWKIEGYAYFIQYNDKVVKNNHLRHDYVKMYYQYIREKAFSNSYSSYALLVGFLLVEKHLNFDQLMINDVTSEKTLNDLEQWYIKNNFEDHLKN